MADFRVGDRVRATATTRLSDEFHNKVGTVVDATDHRLVVSFDEVANPARLQGWYVSEEYLVPWVDAALDTPEDVERFLDA